MTLATVVLHGIFGSTISIASGSTPSRFSICTVVSLKVSHVLFQRDALSMLVPAIYNLSTGSGTSLVLVFPSTPMYCSVLVCASMFVSIGAPHLLGSPHFVLVVPSAPILRWSKLVCVYSTTPTNLYLVLVEPPPTFAAVPRYPLALVLLLHNYFFAACILYLHRCAFVCMCVFLLHHRCLVGTMLVRTLVYGRSGSSDPHRSTINSPPSYCHRIPRRFLLSMLLFHPVRLSTGSISYLDRVTPSLRFPNTAPYSNSNLVVLAAPMGVVSILVGSTTLGTTVSISQIFVLLLVLCFHSSL
uniref:Uncharacterized protein n=1 Tax=Lygus hesperus TaxID=30085 RepID=A0A0A9X2H4_LYGHE